jgi:trans-2,3-dihydro-3-hydroxyanthranilate isomerase
MRYRFVTLDVFTAERFGGNPLAVLPEAEGLSDAQMQKIAREFNLSETTFVLKPETAGATHKVRIFTPVHEMPFAGHPTVGTASLLLPEGQSEASVVLEEKVGLVAAEVSRKGMLLSATFTAPLAPFRRDEPGLTEAEAAEILNVPAEDISAPAPLWSAGVPYFIVPLRSRKAVDAASFNLPAWRRIAATTGRAYALYLLTPDEGGPHAFYARMFSQHHEDAATGSAACAAAGYLAATAADGTTHWQLRQGVAMGRPSLLRLSAEVQSGHALKVQLGGECVPVSEGWIEAGD